MTDENTPSTADTRPAVGGPVERMVRPGAEALPLLACRMCGGKPFTYDLRETHGICTVECGSCNHDVEADTPEAAAAKWYAARA